MLATLLQRRRRELGHAHAGTNTGCNLGEQKNPRYDPILGPCEVVAKSEKL